MRLIWYNRDKFSDQDIRQSKAVANRLLGKRGITQTDYEELTEMVMLKSRQIGMSSYNTFSLENLGWKPSPQWAKDAKEDDRKSA